MLAEPSKVGAEGEIYMLGVCRCVGEVGQHME